MKCVFAEEQMAHAPKSFLVNGVITSTPEKPERADILKNALEKHGHSITRPGDYGLDAIRAVHDDRYISYLERAHERWSRIPGASEEIIPNIHPLNRNNGYPKSVAAQAGYHSTDTSAPISKDTWHSILWSAWTAIEASEMILNGEKHAYALCRPPGHHASKDTVGGFCYFNNTAIATQNLLKKYSKIAILDVDLHHGNGTQEIFYDRDDVLTLSVHADPERFYPFFWGYTDEIGTGAGEGYNINYPLPLGSGDDPFMECVEDAMKKIKNFGAEVVVIALGLDAYEGDPFAGLAVTTEGYNQMAKIIASYTDTPILMVQEGGYICDELGDNLVSFLRGIED
ncbi:histone deacetylase family protein [Pseudemcibacter aquimaris]|uniref:histone deacetylase family protein n=1 Tax=Pseudemcibacter aquimaris TaxID=2857064 RepID=UPI0020136B2D|nr:histone deacetylase family protein [Pseudemcibacter aquimaris]MCC3859995.1 histone deacetylase family protein [Pseudemcibacter aquimaris]WDU57326.1 histone deacetylase family protein [Pseudemcibacter aquimaris]